jgi:hypothetical protein
MHDQMSLFQQVAEALLECVPARAGHLSSQSCSNPAAKVGPPIHR